VGRITRFPSEVLSCGSTPSSLSHGVACLRSEDLPQELMISVAVAVMPNGRPDRLQHLVETTQQVLDREIGQVRYGSTALFTWSTYAW